MNRLQEIPFKLGDVDMNTMFKITVPDYGRKVQELNNMSTPIIYPTFVSAWKIINMIQKGFHINLSPEDSEKLYFFVAYYNRQATILNNESGEIINPIAQEAETYLSYKVKTKIHDEEIKEEEVNKNPFKPIFVSKNKVRHNVYNNSTIQDKFRKKKKSQNIVEEAIPNRAPRLYDMFSDSVSIAPDGRAIFNNKNVDLNRDMPEYMEDIDFSGGSN